MSQARNHHFVPQGYLRAFADGLGRKAKIHTIDIKRKRAFSTLVRNIAASRDFNRLDVENVDPNFLETEIAKFESLAVPALKQIEKARSFPQQNDRTLVLNMVALLASNSPHLRNVLGNFGDELVRMMAQTIVNDEHRFDSAMRKVHTKSDETEGIEQVTYEQAREYVHSKDFCINLDKTYKISMTLQATNTILKLLLLRKWTLIIADESAGDFITSDHPVCLIDSTKLENSAFWGTSFGTAEKILFPINRKMAICGEFNGIEATKNVGLFEVAWFNSHIINRAIEQVYSFNEHFNYLDSKGLNQGTQLIHET